MFPRCIARIYFCFVHNRSWTNKQVLAIWNVSHDDMDIMRNKCSVVAEALDNGYQVSRMRTKLNTLQRQQEKSTLDEEKGECESPFVFVLSILYV